MPVLGDQTSSPATSFAVEELSGDQRLVVLQGRALPYKTLELSGTMRAQVTYYAGNPVGTIQVLGAQEEPTTINGQWKDRFIQTTEDSGAAVLSPPGSAVVNGAAVANVRALVKVFDDIRRKGQLVEMRWDEQVRRGILTRFTARWQNIHDVEWEAQFTWISQGEETADPTFVEVDQQGVASQIKDSAARVAASSAWPTTAIPASSDVFIALKKLNDDISTVTIEAQSTIASTVSQATSPIDAAYRTLAVLQHAQASAQATMDFTQQQVDRSVIKAPIDTITLGQTLIASLYLRQLRSDSNGMRSVALRNRESMRDKIGVRAAPAVHIMMQGEDLREVATHFYGSPDDWRRIALFNGLGGAQVAVGTQILVPPASRDASRAGVV